MLNSDDTVSGDGKQLADELLIRRLTLGLSQHDLGRRIGVSTTAVSSWETGQRRPKAKLVPDIASALKCEASFIARLVHSAGRAAWRK